MTISLLADRPELAQDVIALLNDEFGTALGAHFYEELVLHSMERGRLPVTAVAVEDGRLLGTVGIWRTDMLCRQDLTPWLACLVVDKSLRCRGIGRALQEFVKTYCREQGYAAVYLYTDLVNYYEKSGWRYLGPGYELDGSAQKIYEYPLRDTE